MFGSSFTSEGFFPNGKGISGFFQRERVIVDFPGEEVLVDFSRGRGN